jgi:acyl dehydratase
MTDLPSISLDALQARTGEELGVSSWLVVDQSMIDRFADVTDDHQFIHVDPVRAAAETPFGGAIAHGFLTLSLLSRMGAEVLPRIEGRIRGINYGFDRVRFLAPVPAGGRVRGRFVLIEAARRSPAEVLIRTAVTVELESAPRPALAADWLTLTVLDPALAGDPS